MQKLQNGLVGAKIKFPKVSVGATENLMIACMFSKRTNCSVKLCNRARN